MGKFFGTGRVLSAAVLAVVLVGGAYYLARGAATPPVAQASTETAILQAIATKDSTGDGLPDWQKSLYGIPLNATTTDYFNLGMTDGEAVAKGLIVPKAIADLQPTYATTTTYTDDGLPPPPAPNTLTAQFAQNFFTLYVAAKQSSNGADLTQDQLASISNQAISQLTAMIASAPDFKSAQDLIVRGSGAAALTSFAASAQALFAANKANATTSEINYLNYATVGGDESAYAHISAISKAYRDSAVGLSQLPVPKELAGTDLALINALARIGQITNDFTLVNSDPLATMLALQQYPDAVLALGNAFISIGKVYKDAGITLTKGQPGADFVNLITDVAADQAAARAKKP